MVSQVTGRRTATTDELARRRLQLMAAEHVVRMGRRIAQRREELGLSQNDLARLMPGKVGAQQVSKWERGLHKPHPETLEHLAKALQTTVAHFMLDEPQAGTPDLMGKLADVENGELVEVLRRLVERQAAVEAALAELAEHVAAALPGASQGPRRAAGS